jgi:hypothetical protein
MNNHLMPDRILQLGFGFWGSKALLSAVELGLFTELARSPEASNRGECDIGEHFRLVFVMRVRRG